MQEYAEAVRISPRIQRLVAPNPGVMTGPGTNTYIVGTDELAVIDPGPAIDEHIEHILKVGNGRIGHILCTHTVPDAVACATSVGLSAAPLAPGESSASNASLSIVLPAATRIRSSLPSSGAIADETLGMPNNSRQTDSPDTVLAVFIINYPQY